jgi:hypothetical protein
LDEEVWIPASGNPWPDGVPYDQGRAAYVGLNVSF